MAGVDGTSEPTEIVALVNDRVFVKESRRRFAPPSLEGQVHSEPHPDASLRFALLDALPSVVRGLPVHWQLLASMRLLVTTERRTEEVAPKCGQHRWDACGYRLFGPRGNRIGTHWMRGPR